MIAQHATRLLCAALVAAPTLTLAEGDSKAADVIIPEAQSNTWEHNAYLYGWLASLKGKVGINGLPTGCRAASRHHFGKPRGYGLFWICRKQGEMGVFHGYPVFKIIRKK